MENQNNPDPVNPPVNASPDQNPTPPTPPVAPKKGLNWKGFLLALVIVGLLDWGALTVLHSEDNQKLVPPTAPTPTQNPTTTWKTYTNEMWGLSLKYPAQYEISYGFASFFFTTTQEEKKAIEDCIDKKTCENYYLWTTVRRITNQGSEDITTAIKKDTNNSDIDTYTKTTIDGHNAFEVVGNVPNQTGRKSLSLYIDFKTSVLHLETLAVDAQAMDQYKKILATFQFSNQNVQVETQTPAPSNDQVACTDEARQCPDGSYVGRSGPKCEFVCPK